MKKSRRKGRGGGLEIHKPRGRLHRRVAKVGPQHFGIVSVDCAKARSKWMLADFYGRVLVEPTVVEHTGPALDSAVGQVREAIRRHGIRDQIVAVEQTGRYHKPVARAFRSAGFEVRLVHPLISRHFRALADPGVKTDDKDLAGIHQAAVNGFALAEPEPEEFWSSFQLLVRHRRDLVQKASRLCCQIKEHLEAAMPGYGACFANLWEHPAALHLALAFGGESSQTAAAGMVAAGATGLGDELSRAKIGFQQRTVQRVIEWARTAVEPDVGQAWHRQIAAELEADRSGKEQQIQALERQIAAQLVRTPYVLLLSIPGINVVSGGEYAGELGPISQYAHNRCITGRAGLYPSRYQSDLVDRNRGRLVRCGNRRLRYAILMIADNLIGCNHHFGALTARWKQAGKDPRDNHVRVGSRFVRISFQMVAGRQVFRHPAVRGRDYVLDKLMRFHVQHGTPPEEMLRDLRAAIGQLPGGEHAAEAAPLAEELAAIQARRRRRGAQPLAEVLPLVLAELGFGKIQSAGSGASGPT